MARPTSYKSEYCKALVQHMRNGLSFESFAGRIGVSRRVLFDWLQVHEEFLHAKEVGEGASLLVWERIGRKYIINRSETTVDRDGSQTSSHSKSESLNAAVWKLNMQNRFKWKAGDSDSKVEPKKSLSELTDEELDQRIKQLESKLNQGIKDAA